MTVLQQFIIKTKGWTLSATFLEALLDEYFSKHKEQLSDIMPECVVKEIPIRVSSQPSIEEKIAIEKIRKQTFIFDNDKAGGYAEF